MADYTIRAGDHGMRLERTLLDEDDNPVDIDGATIEFRMSPIGGGDPLIERAASNDQVSAETFGQVSFLWLPEAGLVPADSATPGFYLAEWVVTYAGGAVQTFPNGGYLLIQITEPVGVAPQAYVSLEEFMLTIGGQGTDYLDQDALRSLVSASRDIDSVCGRGVGAFGSVDAQTRYFTGTGLQWTTIDWATEVTDVFLDEDGDGTYERELTLGTEYTLEPVNAVADGKPYRFIRLRDTIGWPPYTPNIKVVGTFGWAAVPENIKTATILLANRYMKRVREAPFAMVDGETTQTMIARSDPDVWRLLRPYARPPMAA